MQRIAIQGYEGSFHQIAARYFFGNTVEVVPCNTFTELVKKVSSSERCDGAMMAIENSIAGSILPNYSLIKKASLGVLGEIYLQINQELMVNPGVTIDEIEEVHSHPMALLQCIDYLEKHPDWKLVETEDTALSAKNLMKNKNRNVAVIASSLAAEIYGLQIVAPKIQSNKNNYTRFLYLQPQLQNQKNIGNKASVQFITDHTKGSLAKVLSEIALCDINLSKLQSVPVPEQEWHYSFHADLEFDKMEQLDRAVQKISSLTEELNVLGIYEKGRIINV